MANFKRNSPGCRCCERNCIHCTNGWPTSWTVDIASVGAGACAVGDCSSLNATYVVDNITVTPCQSQEPITNVCNYIELFVSITKPGADYVLLVRPGGASDLRWEKNLGTTKPDCRTFSGEICLHVSNLGQCSSETPGSTATVTAN